MLSLFRSQLIRYPNRIHWVSISISIAASFGMLIIINLLVRWFTEESLVFMRCEPVLYVLAVFASFLVVYLLDRYLVKSIAIRESASTPQFMEWYHAGIFMLIFILLFPITQCIGFIG